MPCTGTRPVGIARLWPGRPDDTRKYEKLSNKSIIFALIFWLGKIKNTTIFPDFLINVRIWNEK